MTGVEHTLLDLELAALKAWLRVRGSAPGPLFGSRKHGPVGRHQIWVLMKRYAILAAIPLEKAHPHALKHSCATHAARLLDGNVVELQDHLGHADIRSTMRYIRATQRDERAELLAGWENASVMASPCHTLVAVEQPE